MIIGVRLPIGFFTDVRLETEYSTVINLKDLELKQNKRRIKSGALIRIFHGDRWYYSSVTDIGRDMGRSAQGSRLRHRL